MVAAPCSKHGGGKFQRRHAMPPGREEETSIEGRALRTGLASTY